VHVRIDATARLLSATLEHGEPLTIRSGEQAAELRSGQTRQLFWQQTAGETAQLGSLTCGEVTPETTRTGAGQ
jgi:hypothetical protein